MRHPLLELGVERVRANGSRRKMRGMGVLAALAGCLALQGCALPDPNICYEIAQGNAPGAPFVGVAPTAPAPVPVPATANTTVNIPITLTSAVASGPAEKPAPEPVVVPEPKWETLPLSSLQKESSGEYRLAPDDVLGVWIGGVLGELNEPPPMRVSQTGPKPSAIGFPVPVRSDGTLALPLVAPIRVGRMTLGEAEAAIRRAYTVDKQILKPGRERIVVTLMRQRENAVVVIRQDAPAGATKGDARGAVRTIRLPASENDVLHALALTGGYPRPEVPTEIVIERASAGPPRFPELVPTSLADEAAPGGSRRTCIALNYPSSRRPLVPPQDVVLREGDVMVVRPVRPTGPVPTPAGARD